MAYDVDGTIRTINSYSGANMLTSAASWMVPRNGTSGICGLTLNGGANQPVSNVAISTICDERGVSKDSPGL